MVLDINFKCVKHTINKGDSSLNDNVKRKKSIIVWWNQRCFQVLKRIINSRTSTHKSRPQNVNYRHD